MKFHDLIDPALSQHSRGPVLARLHELYARIEEAQAAFKASFARASLPDAPQAGLGCPEGCGGCCEGFVPDILPLEAEYLAAWLLSRRPEATSAPAEGPPPCPFYDPDNPAAHCSVYPARPLVCRLFAFSASRDKGGRPAFALCRAMSEIPGIEGRSWSGEELLALGGADLPVMPDYASALISLDPSGADQRASLGKALESALGKLSLARSYASAGLEAVVAQPQTGKSDDDEPEPNAPAPLAA